MKKYNRFFIYNVTLLMLLPMVMLAQSQPKLIEVDVCVYGGTSAGVMAAYTAKMLNKTVVLIEPGNRIGGLSSGGLGFTDIGNKYVVTGLARDFYRRVGQHYGKFEQWTFEPKVAEALFLDYVKRGGFQLVYNRQLSSVSKAGTVIKRIQLENAVNPKAAQLTIGAKQFIDCSYEGDLMAKAGVSYTIGRESNAVYNETVNGVQLRNKHQFPDGIDPYKEPGIPKSGLLWGISAAKLNEAGTGDKKVQAYNFRICLTSDSANCIPITRPQNYDSTRYELLLRYLGKQPSKDLWAFLKMDLMPNSKTDINNNGPFSTDMIGMNYAYPNADYKTRAAIIKQHEDYTKGLLYFIGHDTRMPGHLRKQMLKWGYPKDEYTNNGNWTPQLYVREARRMVGVYVMTEANCLRKDIVADGIGQAAYTMDSHNAQRLVVNGMVKNEGDVQLKGIKPYPVSFRSITPKAAQCSNLLVPVCLSASHMAYGSIRMEPVFMVLAQSAAVASCMAIDAKTPVQEINIKQLQDMLKANPLADHSTPEILIDNEDKEQVSLLGNWKTETNDGYGPSLLTADLTSDNNAWARFTPLIGKAGQYHIYAYFPKIQNATTSTHVNIFDGSIITKKLINKDDIKVVGQTSGEWVSLGISTLPAGKASYVQIAGGDSKLGLLVADAVLLVPVNASK